MSLAAAAALLPAFESRRPQTPEDWRAFADLLLGTAEDIAAGAELTGESPVCTEAQFEELLMHFETAQHRAEHGDLT
jgi:hypothetical protein